MVEEVLELRRQIMLRSTVFVLLLSIASLNAAESSPCGAIEIHRGWVCRPLHSIDTAVGALWDTDSHAFAKYFSGPAGIAVLAACESSEVRANSPYGGHIVWVPHGRQCLEQQLKERVGVEHLSPDELDALPPDGADIVEISFGPSEHAFNVRAYACSDRQAERVLALFAALQPGSDIYRQPSPSRAMKSRNYDAVPLGIAAEDLWQSVGTPQRVTVSCDGFSVFYTLIDGLAHHDAIFTFNAGRLVGKKRR